MGSRRKAALVLKIFLKVGLQKSLGLLPACLKEKFLDVESFAISGNIEKSIAKITEFNPDVIFNFVESS